MVAALKEGNNGVLPGDSIKPPPVAQAAKAMRSTSPPCLVGWLRLWTLKLYRASKHVDKLPTMVMRTIVDNAEIVSKSKLEKR